MRNLKRALSLALASVMLLGMMVVGSSAAGYRDVDSQDNQEAIEVLQAVGIMTGDENGNFNPDKTLTRNEMAVVMCNLMAYVVSSYHGAATFSDVPAWAADYVSACATNGIVSGIGDGKYGGDLPVTTGQAGLMLMKALGYFQYGGDFGQDWLVATTKKGNEIGLFDNIDNGATAALTRNQAAQMVLNALEADMVSPDGNGNITISPDGTITSNATYNARTSRDSRYAAISDAVAPNGNYTIQLGEDLYKGELEKEDTTDAAGRPGTRWIYNNDEINSFGNSADRTYVVEDAEKNVEYFLQDSDYMNLGTSSTRYAFSYTPSGGGSAAGKTSLAINGNSVAYGSAPTTVLQKGDVIEIYLYDDTVTASPAHNRGDIEKVVVLRYNAALIDEIDTDVTSDQKRDGVTALVTLKDVDDNDVGAGTYYDTINATANSDEKEKELKGFVGNTYVEGAAIAVAVNSANDQIVDSYLIDVVSGQPTAARAAENGSDGKFKNGNVTVGGTKYNYAGSVDGVTTSFTYDFDKEYNVYTTREGYVLAVDGANGVSIDDVYYVAGVYFVQNNYGTKTWYAQSVLLSDGTITDIKIDSDFAKAANGSGFDSLQDMLDNTGASNYYLKKATTAHPLDGVATTDVFANAKEQTLYLTKDKLYTFDKDGEPEVWDGDGDYDILGVAGNLALTDDFKTADKRIEVGGKRYYANADTRYVNVDDVGDDIDVKTATGGMSAKTATKAIVIKDGSTAVYVVYIGEVKGAAEAVVYLAEQPNVSQGKDKWAADLYFMEDNSTESVTVDKDYAAGFYTYSINSDGIYELDDADSEEITDSDIVANDHIDGDAEGWIQALVITGRNGNTMLNGNMNGNAVADVEFGSAKILDDDKDNHPAYDYNINSANRLKSAIDECGTVVADVYVKDGDITFVYVTGTVGRSVQTPEEKTTTTAAEIQALPEGVHTPNSIAFAPGDVSGDPSDNVIIRFDVDASEAGTGYSLVIKNASGKTIYTEKNTSATVSAGTGKYFYVYKWCDLNTSWHYWDTSVRTANDTIRGTEGQHGLVPGAIYSYIITVGSTTVATGSFVATPST